MKNRIKIFIVDDDALFLRMLEIQFAEQGHFIIHKYATGEACIENLVLCPDLIILDYHLDEVDKRAMNGIKTLDIIKVLNPDIPVIILSAQDKIEVAINCMHHAAYDYVVKSETSFMRLQKIISTIVEMNNIKKQLNWYMEGM